MAFKLRFEDGQLAQAIGKLRVFRNHARRTNGGVKAAEHLFGRVAVPFGMAAGKIGVAARLGLEQRGVFEDDFVPAFAVAYP